MDSIDVPVLISALVFAGLAAGVWRRTPVCARVILAAATAFGYAAVQYPGMSVEQILVQTDDGLTYLIALARVSGFAAAMVALTLMLRSWATR